MEEKEKQELLIEFYKITAAESPGDMYDIAVRVLNKYGIDPAPLG